MHSKLFPSLSTKIIKSFIFVLTLLISSPSFAEEQKNESSNSAVETDNFSLEKLRLFSEVYNRIRQSYVDEIDKDELFKNAINGMINGLDPHSNFMEKKSYEALQINTVGEFGGLGITVSMENDFIKVVSPIDDTPADKAGIKAGDLIILLDDVRVKGLTLDEAVDKMRGKPGTDIKITVVREGEPKPTDYVITRDIIKLTSVKSKIIGKDRGYLRISHFNLNTINEVNDAFDSFNKQVQGGVKGLIIDLRNNPGGALKSAIDVSDLFLNEGEIVSTKSRSSGLNESFKAQTGDVLDGKPIVIMINNGSASASEIVSGALQDHKRAIIIGTQSFGKASVQSIIPLSQGDALKITTARYYTPSGKSIQSNGITPDIFSPNAKLTISEKDFGLREENLNGHLIGDDEKKSADDELKTDEEKKDEATKKPASEDEKKDDLSDAQKTLSKSKAEPKESNADKEIDDYTLYEATNILNSLILFSEQKK